MRLFDTLMLCGTMAIFIYQYRRSKILLTPSNAFLLSLIILQVYAAYFSALQDRSLATIGQVGNYLYIQWAADELILVISGGVACGVLGYILWPRIAGRARSKQKSKPARLTLSIPQLTIGASVTCLVGAALVWAFFIKEGVVPLLSPMANARAVLTMDHPGRYIYTGGFTLLSIGLVFLMAGLALRSLPNYRFLSWLSVAVALGTNFLTASRGTFLGPFVAAGLIYFSVRNRKLTIPRAIAIMAALLLAASAIQALRSHAPFSLGGLEDEVLYGNTFCGNLRDSSWVLMSFHAARYPLYYGRTILAGILGFIPSSILPFRQEYGWGRITLNVVNIKGRYNLGLGQVLFADWYINFGLVGVLIEGLVVGFVLRIMDTRLMQIRSNLERRKSGAFFEIFRLWFFFGILGVLLNSANIMLVYPELLGYALILAIAFMMRQIFGLSTPTTAKARILAKSSVRVA